MGIERQKDENYLAYLRRIIELTKEKKISYLEMGDCLLGEDNCYGSENLRKSFYVLNKIIDKIDDNVTITDADILKEIELQKDELFKETVRLRDKKREINNDLRKMARLENLENVLISELRSQDYNIGFKRVAYTPNECTQAALLLSDFHYGIEIDNPFNKYNSEVCQRRLEELASRTVEYCKLHNVKTLNVEILGDLISGMINVSNRVEQEEDIISQIIKVSRLLKDMVMFLYEQIPTVRVITVFGNHARANANKKEQINRENFERLIYHFLKESLPTSIEFIDGGSNDYVCYSIDNRQIIVSHGDKDNPNNAISNFARLLGVVPDEIHIGHYHSASIHDDNDIEIVVNGSLVSTDDYAMTLRKATKASQILRIYNNNDVCTYKIVVH